MAILPIHSQLQILQIQMKTIPGTDISKRSRLYPLPRGISATNITAMDERMLSQIDTTQSRIINGWQLEELRIDF